MSGEGVIAAMGYAPGTAEYAASVFLAGKGQNVTPTAIAARVRAVQAAAAAAPGRLARTQRWREEALGDGRRVARIIARARVRYGKGPTWVELSRFLGWSTLEGQVKLKALCGAGWITCTRERRSLDVGPLYIEREQRKAVTT